MQSKKFLNVIIGVILVTLVTSVALFTARDKLPRYMGETTPYAVVNNFLIAILYEDYPKAYSYLAEWEQKPDFAEFENRVNGLEGYQYCLDISDYPATYPDRTVIQIYSYNCQDEKWQIDWETFKENTNPEFTPNDAHLVRQDNQWKIRRMPLPWWDQNWIPETDIKE
ncbi:MAG: hypothetical protein CVU39_23215 [Chloroflexi bacterium HGW-Chloroflexi-10]|nr:MAG: hypothetical protein CVU39_23215 [Chloroflexi bacterium HGW-Chloroflexi-10]